MSTATASLTATQLAWAKKIVARIKSRFGDTDEARRMADIALATALVESGLRMYANGNNPASLKIKHDAVGWDHGSVGLFQQQVGGARNSTANWGTTKQLMDVNASTDAFINALRRFNWKSWTNGAAAQHVQGSAFPDRYADQDARAIGIRKALWAAAPTKKPSVVSKVVSKVAAVVKPKTYTVRVGDTLTRIAAAHATTVSKLVKLNKIKNPNLIYPGQRIKL